MEEIQEALFVSLDMVLVLFASLDISLVGCPSFVSDFIGTDLPP